MLVIIHIIHIFAIIIRIFAIIIAIAIVIIIAIVIAIVIAICVIMAVHPISPVFATQRTFYLFLFRHFSRAYNADVMRTICLKIAVIYAIPTQKCIIWLFPISRKTNRTFLLIVDELWYGCKHLRRSGT